MSNAPVIGLHMIVRDEEASIVACLDSVLPHVQAALILDTGSTDGTPGLVRDALERHTSWDPVEATATMEWPEDFSAARNEALRLLRERHPDVTHVLWLDADDVLHGGEHLPVWAAAVSGQQQADGTRAGAAVMHYAYAHDPAGNLSCSHHRERLVCVEALGEAPWVDPIHEVMQLRAGWTMLQVPAPAASSLSRVPNMEWPLAVNGVEVIHLRPAAKAAVTEGRNRVILERILEGAAAEDVNPRVLFYLGQEQAIRAALAQDRGETEEWAEYLTEAIRTLERYDALATWTEERYQARHRRADWLRALGDHRAAIEVDRSATDLLPGWPDAWLGLADSYLAEGNPDAARTYSDAGLSRPYPRTMLILNPTDYTTTAWAARARIEAAAGDVTAAASWATRAVEGNPADPHLQALAADLMEAHNRGQVRDALLVLDECLARHDENLKAARLLTDCIPYFLTGDPEIHARRQRRRAGVRHVQTGGRDVYRDYYGEDNPHIPITRALGVEDPREAVLLLCEGDEARGIPGLPRARFLLEGLRQQAGGEDLSCLHLIDCGCNDGWMGWWLTAIHGLGRYSGWDLNPESIAGAESYRASFPEVPDGAVTFHVGDLLTLAATGAADAVCCFEVIEHVPDPDALLRGLSHLVRPEGRVYISTPNGAYERGNIPAWDDPNPRGHVRAMTAADVGALLLDHGDLEGLTETRDALVVAAVTPRPRRGTLDVYTGGAGGTWSPLDALHAGLGGSETMACRLAGQAARHGWRVRVWCGVPHRMAVQGAEYLPFWMWDPVDPVDVLVSSRHPGLLARRPNAGRTALWLHDAEYPDLREYADRWDSVWLVGEVQRDLFAQELNHHQDVHVLGNAIPLERWGEPLGWADREPWVVYSSSPDRGLEYLLDLWPRIRKAVPAAQLHITYGFTQTWQAMEAGSPHLRAVRRRVEDAVSMPGVVWHGGVGQLQLADLQRRARVWAYPTDFPEVSCITAMEAQAAGLAILTTRTAELERTVGAAGLLFPGPVALWDPATTDAYVTGVVACLRDRGEWESRSALSRAGAARWDVDAWGDRVMDLLASPVEAQAVAR